MRRIPARASGRAITLHIPREARQRLAAAAAYFRTARRRNTGAAVFYEDDWRAAAADLEELLRRCHVKL